MQENNAFFYQTPKLGKINSDKRINKNVANKFKDDKTFCKMF